MELFIDWLPFAISYEANITYFKNHQNILIRNLCSSYLNQSPRVWLHVERFHWRRDSGARRCVAWPYGLLPGRIVGICVCFMPFASTCMRFTGQDYAGCIMNAISCVQPVPLLMPLLRITSPSTFPFACGIIKLHRVTRTPGNIVV